MNTNASKQAPSNKGESKKSKKAAAKAAKNAAPIVEGIVVDPPAPPTPAPVATRVIGEHIVGKTLNGPINVTVKRRTLKTESKVALMKRLLTTPGQTKESILIAATPLHTGSAESLVNTLNTVRADLRRVVGDQVCATGWRTDGKDYKAPTAAVARLRTHKIGGNAFSQGAVEVPIVEKPAKAAKAKVETKVEAKVETPAEQMAEAQQEVIQEAVAELEAEVAQEEAQTEALPTTEGM